MEERITGYTPCCTPTASTPHHPSGTNVPAANTVGNIKLMLMTRNIATPYLPV
jgi:hypothetical protein